LPLTVPRPVDAAPGLEELQDRLDLAQEDAVHRPPARCSVDQALIAPMVAPPGPTSDPVLVEVKPPTRAALRPALVDGVLDQIEQAGLAGTGPVVSPNALPSCRSRATACSVTVARNRSISLRASAK
jgi:hypothetical protein